MPSSSPKFSSGKSNTIRELVIPRPAIDAVSLLGSISSRRGCFLLNSG
jgi:hypothetical protein